MTSPVFSIATVHGSSHASSISSSQPISLKDLTAALTGEEPKPRCQNAAQCRCLWHKWYRHRSMLRTAEGLLCTYLKRPSDQIEASELGQQLASGFRCYLETQTRPNGSSKYSRNAVRAYVGWLKAFIKVAQRLGCLGGPAPCEEAWGTIRASLPRRSRQIVDFAIAHGKLPADFGDETLDAWGSSREGDGRSHHYVLGCISEFRRLVFTAGFNVAMPHLCPSGSRKPYGVGVEDMPEPLRTEVKSLLSWKQAEAPRGRGYKGRLREVSADRLESAFRQLVGFLANKGIYVSTLSNLVTKEHFEAYIEWAVNERHLLGSTIAHTISILFSAVKHYPPLVDYGFDCGWMPGVFRQIPPVPESHIRRAKEAKWVPRAELKKIPGLIDAEIAANPKASKQWLARMVQRQLIIRWLLTLPWRQRNLREMRLLAGKKPANLIRECVPVFTPLDLPPFAEEALKSDANAKLWQYDFDEFATKAGRSVRGVVPQKLIAPFEDFREHHRPYLLKVGDPGTLFVNSEGRPFSQEAFCELVANTVQRYLKRRVTPHIFRDIYAVEYLKKTRDWIGLSKILWHKDVSTTIEMYGRFFNESFSARITEEFDDD